MKVIELEIHGVLLIEPDVYGDERGFFLETYQDKRYAKVGIDVEFVQDNRSFSKKNILRGLHYQIKHPLGQLLYVTRGRILDVGLDLRAGSKTFGKVVQVMMDSKDGLQLYLPPGIAHGFCTLSDENEIFYKCSDYYYADDEGGVRWDDPALGIEWPIDSPVICDRDAEFPLLKDISPALLPSV